MNLELQNINTVNRDTWLKNTLINLTPGLRILDAGAGEQQFKKFCSHLDYVSQDFAQYDGQGDGAGFQTGSWNQKELDIISDITAIPEPDSSFDAIMCVEVFEHLPNPILALKEFSRLLKPGGHLIITAPFCSLTHFSPYHYFSGFNNYFYKYHLPFYGFEIIEILANGNFFLYMKQELERLPFMINKFTTLYSDKDLNFSKSLIYKFRRSIKFRITYLALNIILDLLQKCSSLDKGSNDILCFGYHIHAIKKV